MAPLGKYFQLVSKLSGHVLGLNPGDGAKVDSLIVTCVKNEMDDHQIWFEDMSTGTTRLKINGMCLHVGDDNTLRIRPIEPGNSCQQWRFKDGKIQNAVDSEKVLDISGAKSEPGSTICSWGFHGGPNQLWDQIFLKPKYFYLKSELNGKVLDIEGESADPGTKLCMWDQKPRESAANQLWYEDQEGILRSQLNDFVIDATEANELAMQPFDSDRADRQLWVLHDNYVALAPKMDKVIDIVAQNTENGARLCAWEAHGQSNQKWILEYI